MARKKYQISTSKEKLMTKHLDWMKARVRERTSWDGAACIVLGLIMFWIYFNFCNTCSVGHMVILHGEFGRFGSPNRET